MDSEGSTVMRTSPVAAANARTTHVPEVAKAVSSEVYTIHSSLSLSRQPADQ